MNNSVVNLGGQEKGDIPSDSLKGQKWWSMYQRVVQLIKGILGEDCKAEDIRVDSLCFGARSFEFAIKHFFLILCLSYNVGLPRLTILLELDLSTFSNRCTGIGTNYYN